TPRFRDADHLLQIIERIAPRVGRRIDETSPLVDARLRDGRRVNAVIPPLALRGPTLTVRRFGTRQLIAADRLQLGASPHALRRVREGAIKAKLNVAVSGGTGSGKTTLLNCLSGFMPNRERKGTSLNTQPRAGVSEQVARSRGWHCCQSVGAGKGGQTSRKR